MADLLRSIRPNDDGPPVGFEADTFACYLEALRTEGHDYYLSPDEVLAVAETVQANIVITRLEHGEYTVIGYNLGCQGDIAVLVLRGQQRGHFERLCNVRALDHVQEQHNEEERLRLGKVEDARKASEEEQRLREMERRRKASDKAEKVALELRRREEQRLVAEAERKRKTADQEEMQRNKFGDIAQSEEDKR